MTDRPQHPYSPQAAALAQAEHALRSGRPLPVRTVLRLQQTLGNREVARLLTPRLPAPPAPEVQTLPTIIPPPASSLQQRLAAAWTRLLQHKPPAEMG